MDVRYGERKLEKLRTIDKEMWRQRADIAAKLRLRIKALETALSVGELPAHDPLGDWHSLTADRRNHWSGKLSANHRLVIRPETDAEAWEATTVTVIQIVDYHWRMVGDLRKADS